MSGSQAKGAFRARCERHLGPLGRRGRPL